MNLCKCGCGLTTNKKQRGDGFNEFVRFHHPKKRLFGKDNPMFGKKWSKESNDSRRKKLKGIKKSPLKGLTLEQFYGENRGSSIRSKLSGHGSWNKGLTKETSSILNSIGKKISISRIGSKKTNFKDRYNVRDYGKEFNYELKRNIRARDGYKCSACGCSEAENGRSMDVHHIDSNKKNNSYQNLITVCCRCHRIAHSSKNKQFIIETFKCFATIGRIVMETHLRVNCDEILNKYAPFRKVQYA